MSDVSFYRCSNCESVYKMSDSAINEIGCLIRMSKSGEIILRTKNWEICHCNANIFDFDKIWKTGVAEKVIRATSNEINYPSNEINYQLRKIKKEEVAFLHSLFAAEIS